VTERKPPGVSFESWVDQQIRQASERGDFDNLPGAGKPIPGRGDPYDEEWWLRSYLRREEIPAEDLLPTSLLLLKEIERLPDTVRDLPSEREVRDTATKLNARIMDWLRSPSGGPRVRVRPVDVDAVVERWRADRAAAPPSDPPVVDPLARRGPWWRRILRRRRNSGPRPTTISG